MSYVFTPALTASLSVQKLPEVPKPTLAPVKPVLPVGLGQTAGTSGVGRAVRAVLLGLAVAELDRALVRKGKGKRLDDRYGAIAALVAIIGLEI